MTGKTITQREVLAIGRVVADFCGLTEADFLGPRRRAERCAARDMAWWVARELGAPLQMIGRALNRHHTVVLDGLRRAAVAREADAASRRNMDWALSLVTREGGPLAAEEILIQRQIRDAQARLEVLAGERHEHAERRRLQRAEEAAAAARRAQWKASRCRPVMVPASAIRSAAGYAMRGVEP